MKIYKSHLKFCLKTEQYILLDEISQLKFKDKFNIPRPFTQTHMHKKG